MGQNAYGVGIWKRADSLTHSISEIVWIKTSGTCFRALESAQTNLCRIRSVGSYFKLSNLAREAMKRSGGGNGASRNLLR